MERDEKEKKKKTEFQVSRRTQAEINRENRDGNY